MRREGRVGAELNYLLPHESSANFEQLFNSLEPNRKTLGIESFGASVTTMEEVFIKYAYLPVYTVSLLSALRSAARGDLVVPRTRLQLGNRPFCVAGLVATAYSFGTYIINFQKHAQDIFSHIST